jgi:pyruvate dehydrogenase E2 component (dihydrolipoamide acetyltransferase)
MSDADKLVRIEMPQLSSGGEEESEGATLASWLVAAGDEVEQGEVIAELETDKATVELESPASGRLMEIAVSEGTEGLRPGTLLGTIESGGAPLVKSPTEEAIAPTPSVEAPVAEPACEVLDSPDVTPPIVDDPAGGRSTPLARRAAEANAIDVATLEGSGPGGRIVEADVLRASGAGPSESLQAAPLDVEDGVRIERLSGMRKTIARRLTESKQQVPHFYLRSRVQMDEAMAVRARLNEGLANEDAGIKISLNDFVVRAVAGAMRDVPEANVQFAEDGMRVFDRVDVSVAVATEGGLITPLVRDADRLGLAALAEAIRILAVQARAGSLRPEQYQGGTVTVSNLGMYGIETVYPILNPPQSCIFGVGAAEAQPIVRDGEIGVGHIAMVTLAADHRAVDGAVGARLLAAVRARLEDPLGMML